ncbi:MAG: branched-chain amino acid transport system substrate-binding protein, partial [Candidatus Azotimanducaceae bacterium]
MSHITTHRALVLILSLWLFSTVSMAADSVISHSSAADIVHLYIDADRTGTRASGIAIERGIRLALHENRYRLGGKNVKLVIRDHHGSSVRSKAHLEEYLQDDKALVLFSGLHSPPLLENLKFINENKVLVLDPWAAAGPITRFPSKDNWIFRLSVDDSKAGTVIVENALEEGYRKLYLLLEETGWGKSNEKTMKQALQRHKLTAVGVQW